MELLAGFTVLQIVAALATTLVAAFIRGLAGFGMAILLVPILAMALSPVEAVLVTNFVSLFIGLSEIRIIIRDAENSALAIGAWVLLATAPGLMALAATPPDVARFLIALVALSAFGVVMLPRRGAHQPGVIATGLAGISSGLLTGFAGMPGPPVVPYYVGRDIPRHIAKASMLLIFTIASFASLVSGTIIGALEWRLLLLALMLFPAVLLGNWLGSRAFGKVSDNLWRGFVALMLGATAVVALVKLAFQ